jgi:hypothetical protein
VIDRLLVSHALRDSATAVTTGQIDLPSITDNPQTQRKRNHPASDHRPVIASLTTWTPITFWHRQAAAKSPAPVVLPLCGQVTAGGWVFAHERSCRQRIALTLSSSGVFPMTAHTPNASRC